MTVIMLACVTCVKHSAKQTTNTSLGGAAVLQADWPIKELTLPKGAVRDELPPIMQLNKGQHTLDKIETVGGSNSGYSWAIAFDCPLTWQKLIEHVESCILPTSYKLYEDQPFKKGIYEGWAIRSYVSSDKKIVLKISHNTGDGSLVSSPYDTYVYDATVWSEPVTWAD
jgi:hypothetical protein